MGSKGQPLAADETVALAVRSFGQPEKDLSITARDAKCNVGLDLLGLSWQGLERWLENEAPPLGLKSGVCEDLKTEWKLWEALVSARESGVTGAVIKACKDARAQVRIFKLIIEEKCKEAEAAVRDWNRLDGELVKNNDELRGGVETDMEQWIFEAKSLYFLPAKIEQAELELSRWKKLRATVLEFDDKEIIAAIEEARANKICQRVIDEAVKQQGAIKALNELMMQAESKCPIGMLKVALQGAVAFGVQGKLIDRARARIRIKEKAAAMTKK